MKTEDLIFLFIALVALLLGTFLYYRPKEAFAIQKSFYRLINWNIEPISLEKEVRNTRVMGFILIIFVIGASLYVLLR